MTVRLFACESVVSCDPCPECPSISGTLYLPKSCATNSSVIFSTVRPPDLAIAGSVLLTYDSGGTPTTVLMYAMADAYGPGVNSTVCRRMEPAAAPSVFTHAAGYVAGGLPPDAVIISVSWRTVEDVHFRTYKVGGDCTPPEHADENATLTVTNEQSTFREIASSDSPCTATWGTSLSLGYLAGILPDSSSSGTALASKAVVQNKTGLEETGCDEVTGGSTSSPVTFEDNGYNEFSVPHPDGPCMVFSDTLSFSLSNAFGSISVELSISKVEGLPAKVTGSATASATANASQACDDNAGDTAEHTPSGGDEPADSFTIPYTGGIRICLFLNGGAVTHSSERTADSDPSQTCGCHAAEQWGWRTDSYAVVTPYIDGRAP